MHVTGILEGDVVAVVGAAQFVGHHSQSHDLLPDEGVWAGDVNIHLWITQLIGQAIFHNLWEIPAHDRKQLNLTLRHQRRILLTPKHLGKYL